MSSNLMVLPINFDQRAAVEYHKITTQQSFDSALPSPTLEAYDITQSQ